MEGNNVSLLRDHGFLYVQKEPQSSFLCSEWHPLLCSAIPTFPSPFGQLLTWHRQAYPRTFYLNFVPVGHEVRNVHGITQILAYFKSTATHFAAITDQGTFVNDTCLMLCQVHFHTVPCVSLTKTWEVGTINPPTLWVGAVAGRSLNNLCKAMQPGRGG